MRMRANRPTERAAVNASRSLFEANGFVFQEVDLGNDYGKDAYVDLGDGQTVSGFCIALQIKGGKSFKRTGGYAVPLDEAHEKIWRSSTLPVGGIVHDPDDGLLRWCNISEYLQKNPERGSYIPVAATNVLDSESLRDQFAKSFRAIWDQRAAGETVLQLCSTDKETQISAISHCLAIARNDARILIALRHMLPRLKDDPLRFGVHILSHATPHPDIMWTNENWIPHEICKQVVLCFRWSADEIVTMLEAFSWEEWQRGDIGESLYMLFHEDPDIKVKMREAAYRAAANGSEDAGFAAFYLSLYWCGPKLGRTHVNRVNLDSMREGWQE